MNKQDVILMKQLLTCGHKIHVMLCSPMLIRRGLEIIKLKKGIFLGFEHFIFMYLIYSVILQGLRLRKKKQKKKKTKKKKHFKTEYQRTDSHNCGNFGRINFLLITD